MIRLLLAFPRKEWRIYRSYRFALALNAISIVTGALTFFYVGRLFDQVPSEVLGTTRGYFPFVMVGIAASTFLITTLNGLAMTIRREQDLGTLEAIFVCPVPDFIVILGMTLWEVVLSLLISCSYVFLGMLSTTFDVSFMVIGRTVCVLSLATLTFWSLGAIAAALILYFKHGNPIAWIFSTLSVLVGGVYFPVHLLPERFGQLATLLPLTAAIDALRAILLQQATLADISDELALMALYSIASVPLAILSLNICLRLVRRKGSLSYQ